MKKILICILAGAVSASLTGIGGIRVEGKEPEPETVAAELKGLPYIGTQSYDMPVSWGEDNRPHMAAANTTGVLCARYLDLDGDGTEEIFSVTYEPSELLNETENSIHFSVFAAAGNTWELMTETEILSRGYDGNYQDPSCMNGEILYYEGSVFMREYNGTYEFFYEDYGEGVFATGSKWFLQGFRFEDGKLNQIPETADIYYMGSSWEELPEEIKNQYCGLGFEFSNPSFGNMTTDRYPSLEPLLELKLGSTDTVDLVMEWYGTHDQPLNSFQYTITDTGKTSSDGAEEEEVSGVPVPAYQGIFMKDQTFLSLPLYTSSEEAVGIAYDVTKPELDGSGYIKLDTNTTLGEIFPVDPETNVYEIRGEQEVFVLTYYDKKMTISGGTSYDGTYIQVSNSGANMPASDIWLDMPEQEAQTGAENSGESVNTSEYLLPDSSNTELTKDQLAGLDSQQLQIARNEIYARHGRQFKSAELQSYFSSKSWYQPKYTPEEFDLIEEEILNEIEKKNLELIVSVEEGMR